MEACADGVRVRLRVTPKASANRVRGVAADENGVARLQVSVTAAPEDGRANKAVTKLLAREWRVARSSVEVTAGASSRRKTILVRGDSATLAWTLSDWLAAQRTQGED